MSQCVFVSSAYKGYVGRAEYDEQAGYFHGDVLGLRDVITFEAKDVGGLEREFRKSVDVYLTFCASRGKKPDKPYSGKFVVRLSPKLHRVLDSLASARGESLNSTVERLLQERIDSPETRPAKPTRRRSKAG
jgi:predicted HicB family RNase H-like nuclease